MLSGVRRAAIIAFLVVTGVVTLEPLVLAGEHLRSQVHDRLWYYWPTRTIYYYIQDTAGGALQVGPGAPVTLQDIKLAAARGFAAWSSTPCTDIQFVEGGTVRSRDSNMTNDSVNHRSTIIFRGSDWVRTDCLDAIACTTVVTKRAAGEILDADIDLNAGEYDFVLDPSKVPGTTAYDLQSVLVHEMGHMIGFNHTQDPGAVMWPYASWGDAATRRVLAGDDVNLVCETYPRGQCTVINDYYQSVCPVEPATCSIASVTPGERESGGHESSPALAIVMGAGGLALAIRSLRRRSS